VPLVAGAIGLVVGGGLDLAKQLWVDDCGGLDNVNWAEVGGAAVGGLVAGATMGLAPAGASALTLAGYGALSGAAGGQAQALIQAALTPRQAGSTFFEDANQLGFWDLQTAAIDGVAGAATGMIGGAISRSIGSSELLSGSPDQIIRRAQVPVVRQTRYLDGSSGWLAEMQGRELVFDATGIERIIRSAIQGGYELTENLLLEITQQGIVALEEEVLAP